MTKILLKLSIVLVLLVSSVTSVSAKKLEEQVWHEVTSENFNIYSTLSVEDATGLLHTLELFRKVIPVITNIKSTESIVPTTIISVKRSSELGKLGFKRRTAGAFSRSLRNNLIVIRNSKYLETNQTILHEYVHFLMHNSSSLNYPRWFSEGFAEYLGSARLNEDVFEVGRFPPGRPAQFSRVRLGTHYQNSAKHGAVGVHVLSRVVGTGPLLAHRTR